MNTYIKKFNDVMQELQFSCHDDLYIRENNNKRYKKMTFVFNLYLCPDSRWRPLYLCYINDIKQYGYTDSRWHQSDRIYDAYEHRLKDCESEYCYCNPDFHHTFEIKEENVKRYFQLVLDIGNVIDGVPRHEQTYNYLKKLY